jgi:1,2-diacylglycerol 3-beta-glucosyltransferase
MEAPFDGVRTVATVLVLAVAGYAYALALIGQHTSPSAPGTRPLFFVLLVPCLNEAPVIGQTLDSLTGLRGRFHIVVLDDDSDDESRAVVRRHPERLVTLVSRAGEDARVGKGAALNQGYREVLGWHVDALYGLDNIILVVFDADTRVPPDLLERMSPYFSDPDVVGVQAGVRMYNAGRNWLTFWQNLEFVVWGRIFSRAKDRIGSATLGGNGQCVRLSALISLGPAPWRPSLTEDLDLSLRLILNGGRIRFCGDANVSQEAVPRVTQLIRQRARWIQGHLVSWQHLPTIIRSTNPLLVRLDLIAFLLLPAALVPVALATVDGWWATLSHSGTVSLEAFIAWYALAFASAPLTAWALIREGEGDRHRALVQAHLFLGYSIFWMVAVWRAIWSVLRGDRAWAKTSRTAVPPAPAASPDEAVDGARLQPLRREFPRNRWRLRVLAGMVTLSIVASSGLVGIALMSISMTYAEVAGTGRETTPRGDVAGITGRPATIANRSPLVSPAESSQPIASPRPSLPASLPPTPAPTPTKTPTPVPTRPPGQRITERFPELTPCRHRTNCYVYVVRSGNNFFSIVRYYRVDYAATLRMNPGLDNPSMIEPGDTILIPTPLRPHR